MNLTKVKDIVEYLLKQFEYMRDSDEYLISAVWNIQNPDLLMGSYEDFVLQFRQKQLASTESIRRCRQKIQQINPALRGKNYKGKQAHQEDVKQQLKDF